MAYTGSLALRLTGLEELLARSARFRSIVGAADILAAKNKVYVGELADILAMVAGGTLDVARPCAIIGCEMHAYQQIGQGASIDLGASGAAWVIFTDNAKNPTNHKLSLLDFVDWTSGVMDQVAELVGADVGAADFTLWPFTAMRMFFEPFRPDLADRAADDYWLAGYVLYDNINAGGG